MIERLFNLKIPAIFISVILMVIGILAIIQGAHFTYEGALYLLGVEKGKAGATMIEAVDTYLFAMVIMILGAGIFKLFAGNENTFKKSAVLSKINTFAELKVLLWETLLLTLTVWCAMDFFLTEPEDMHLEQLILPASVLILAAALRLVKGHGKH